MPTPLKDPAVRQRRNRESTAAKLVGQVATTRPLPERADGVVWRPEALELWQQAWASPMAKEFTEADVPGLMLLIDLTHQYWTKPSIHLASELRQQRAAYGLDPLARRRLGWKLEPAKEPVEVRPPRTVRDPRLRAVS